MAVRRKVRASHTQPKQVAGINRSVRGDWYVGGVEDPAQLRSVVAGCAELRPLVPTICQWQSIGLSVVWAAYSGATRSA